MLGSGRLKLMLDKELYERPRKKFREKKILTSNMENFHRHCQLLDEKGCITIDNYFTGNELKSIQKEFERLIQMIPADIDKETNVIHFPTAMFDQSYALGKLAFRQDFIDIAEFYYGKPIMLVATGGTRLLPFSCSEDYGSYQWHHDGKRKQLRIMILLRDTPDSGQRMDYIEGTHRVFRWNTSDSRLSRDRAYQLGEAKACVGKAGTIVIFDTNGIHRGNRNNGPIRDTWQYTYRAVGGYAIQTKVPLNLPSALIPELSDYQRRIARLT